MLMTPGLAFFYGGLVGRKNVLAIMIQSFISLGWTTVLWFSFGYSMCFGPTIHGIIGDPTYYAFLRGIGLGTMFKGNDAGIPLVVHVAYQMMFAIITPALITGAFANRVTFKAYFYFSQPGSSWCIFRSCTWSGARMASSRNGECSTLPGALLSTTLPDLLH